MCHHPSAHGWTKTDGQLVPFWTEEAELILPLEMAGLLTEDLPDPDDPEDESAPADPPEQSLSSSGEETDTD